MEKTSKWLVILYLQVIIRMTTGATAWKISSGLTGATVSFSEGGQHLAWSERIGTNDKQLLCLLIHYIFNWLSATLWWWHETLFNNLLDHEVDVDENVS